MSELKLSERIQQVSELLEEMERNRIEREVSRATLELWKVVAMQMIEANRDEAKRIVAALRQEMYDSNEEMSAHPNARIIADAFSAFVAEAYQLGIQ